MFTSRNRLLIATLACGLMLAACDDSAPDPNATPAVASKKPIVPKIPGLAPEMVAAVSGGNTATVVSVHFAIRSAPTVNQALPVDIVIVPHRELTAVRAHFEARDGVVATAGDSFGPKSDPAVEKPLEHRLVLMPSREGMFMVTAVVETEDETGSVTRIFTIPVIVGTGVVVLETAPTPETAAPAAK